MNAPSFIYVDNFRCPFPIFFLFSIFSCQMFAKTSKQVGRYLFYTLFCFPQTRVAFLIKLQQDVCYLRHQVVAFHCIVILSAVMLDVITDIFPDIEPFVFYLPSPTSYPCKFPGILPCYHKIRQPLECLSAFFRSSLIPFLSPAPAG